MPFGRTARAVRTYQFGAMAPREGWEPTLAQHRHRTALWNALTEIERGRRERLDAMIVAAMATIPAETITPGDEAAETRAAREHRRAAARLPETRAALKALDQECYEAAKAARHELVATGLYWPNYLDVERHFQTASKRPDAPRFHRFDPREGRVAFPFTNGCPVSLLLAGGDSRARLEPLAPWSERVGPRHGEQTRLLRLRVGMEARAPVWLALPIFVHRPLPETGILREIAVNWRRRGTKVVWSVTMVVEDPTAVLPEAMPSGPAVAVDLCWRQRPNGGIRAAYWVGEDGGEGEVLLPDSWLAAMDRVEGLRGTRDKHLNAVRAALIAWIDAAPGVPEWLREPRRWMHQWHAAARFAALVLRWRDQRFPGDDAGYALLEEWRKRDKHLAEWEANLRDNLLGERRERYRLLAATLSRRYERVIVEEFDLYEVAQEPGRREVPAPVRHQRVLVAPSLVRAALVNAFTRDHGAAAVLKVPAAYTTLACHVCGAIDRDWDPAATLMHQCPTCGAVWDQDAGACRNLLARANQERAAVG